QMKNTDTSSLVVNVSSA
ncbi:hypothetical protein L195_g048714, partial [Trifolium pratense]